MKVLVTGSTGFIGSQLCRALCAQGYQVRAFHRSTSSLRAIQDLEVERWVGDLTQPETLRSAMQGIEVVYHTAAQLGGSSPGRHRANTVEGTRNVLEAAASAGVRRVIHTSSVAALGVPERVPGKLAGQPIPLMNENHTWNYRPEWWRYGYAKYLAELEVQKAVAKGLDAVIVNPAVVFGAGDLYRGSSSLVVQVARRQIPAWIDGGLNAVHITDVVEGHLAACEQGQTGERYILGGENILIHDLLQMIAQVCGVEPPALHAPGALLHFLSRLLQPVDGLIHLPVDLELFRLAGHYFYYDLAKMRGVLMLQNPRPARQGVQEAFDWFRAEGIL